MTEQEWLADWRASLAAGEVGVTLVEVVHPLEVFVGVNEFGRAKLQIRTTECPLPPLLADVVEVVRHGRDGRWVLSLNLRDQRFTEVFLQLAADLVRRTRGAAGEQAALEVLSSVLDQWRRLLTPAPRRRLSLDELRGLVGELWHLLHRARFQVSMREALEAWVGPLGAPQDFVFEEHAPREVKAVGPSASRVKIANEHQLDVLGMELVVLDLPQVPEAETPGAMTLVTLLESVAALLDEVGVGHDGLHLRIKRLGVDLGDDWYSEQWFRVAAEAVFEISADFPAIRASELGAGIEMVRYELTRSAIEPFKTVYESFS